ncbi:hypothetical protein SSS_02843 [Sarcoptes scabiei]|uniref:Uncharacterized protein n=1 Tax=Sarcoptes scabiei TaxID=52283 RepID=A0A834VDL5_SARSC|nr:hypothetical protein SSS_02843 [Sarcoptes scabiei]UXI21235.1 hypothetical protein NH340_JMT07178 [Sarcoptes scabiei]
MFSFKMASEKLIRWLWTTIMILSIINLNNSKAFQTDNPIGFSTTISNDSNSTVDETSKLTKNDLFNNVTDIYPNLNRSNPSTIANLTLFGDADEDISYWWNRKFKPWLYRNTVWFVLIILSISIAIILLCVCLCRR